MNHTYYISHNDGEEIGVAHVALDREDCMLFLLDVHAELYSVGEYDDKGFDVERLNGEEWLEQHTTLGRILKPKNQQNEY